jgi:AraC-like DNA-binding protein
MKPLLLQDVQRAHPWIARLRPRLNVLWRGEWPVGHVQASRICFDHELVVFATGTTRAVVGDLEYLCQPGDVLIQPPGVVQWSQASVGAVERYTFHFDWTGDWSPLTGLPYRFLEQGAVAQRELRPAPEWLPLAMPWFVRGVDPRLSRLLAEIHRHARTVMSASDLLKIEARFMEILAVVLAGAIAESAPSPGLTLVTDVKSALERDLAGEVDLDAVAAQHGVTRDHLTRVVTKRLGLPPIAWRNAQRLEAARRQVRAGSSIADAAAAVGFTDPRYFTRLYTRRFGVPPSQEAGIVHLVASLQPRRHPRR